MGQGSDRPPPDRDVREYHVGADLVREHPDGTLEIASSHHYADWRSGGYRPTVVAFRGKRYLVEQARSETDGFRYRLRPWSNPDLLLAGNLVNYGSATPRAFADSRRRESRRDSAAWFLLALTPLMGLLPGRAQLKLEARYGFDPVSLTARSLMAEGCLLIVCLCIRILPVYVALRGYMSETAYLILLWILDILLLLLPFDFLFRWDRVWQGCRQQYGFGEWLLAPWRKRPRPAGPIRSQPPAGAAGEEAPPEAEGDAPPGDAPPAGEAGPGPVETRTVGGDLLEIRPGGLTVTAARPIPGWRESPYRPVLVRFEHELYAIRSVSELPRGRTMYVLERQKETEAPQLTGAVFDYDGGFVAERDGKLRADDAVRHRTSIVLELGGFVLGLFWSGFKETMELHYGLGAFAATKRSVAFQFALTLFAFLVLMLADWNAPYADPQPYVAAILLAFPEGVIRLALLQKKGARPWGYLEWLFRPGRDA